MCSVWYKIICVVFISEKFALKAELLVKLSNAVTAPKMKLRKKTSNKYGQYILLYPIQNLFLLSGGVNQFFSS